MDHRELGNRIRAAREERNMSAADLAAKLHVGVKRIEAWERGVRPPYFQMPRLSEALDVALYDEDEARAWKIERVLAHAVLTLCVMPLLAVLLAYPLIPTVFPIAVSGETVTWGKSWYWILIGLGATLSAYGIAFGMRRGIRSDRVRRIAAGVAMPVLFAAFVAVVAVLANFASDASHAGYQANKIDPLTFLLTIAGACYVLLGVWAPMLNKNLFLGIRCEGTLKDPAIWSMTHRVAFAHFQLCGIFCMLICVFVPNTNGVIGFIVGTFTMILFPIIYATRKMLQFYPEMNQPRARKK